MKEKYSIFADKGFEFFERRSEEVLKTCVWLAPVMNRVHKMDLSEKFWVRTLLPYVLSAYNQGEHYRAEVCNFPIPFKPIYGWTPPNRKQVLQDKVLTFLRSLKGQYTPKDISSVLPKGGRIAFGSSAHLVAGQIGAIPLSFNWMPYIGLPKTRLRKALNCLSYDAPSTELRNICQQMPRIYVEYLGSILRWAEKARHSGLKEIYVEHYFSLFEKILAAYLSEHGALINQLQTGGFVGETQISVEPLKRVEYDFLLTYGWRIDLKDRPFYAIRLEDFKTRYKDARKRGSDNEILVVYGSSANTENLTNHYESCTSILVESLDRRKYPNVSLRPRAMSRVLRLKSVPTYLQNLPKSNVDSGFTDIAVVTANSRIVVHWTLPSTNFLECIFVDHPVLALDTNTSPTEIIKPYLDAFRDLKVLHGDAQSLVSFLNQININDWWATVVSDPRYQEFKRLFARSRLDWIAENQPLNFNEKAG